MAGTVGALFVGGPLNGERIQVAPGVQTVEVPRAIAAEIEPLPTPAEEREYRELRERLEARRRLSVAYRVPISYTEAGDLERAWRRYQEVSERVQVLTRPVLFDRYQYVRAVYLDAGGNAWDRFVLREDLE